MNEKDRNAADDWIRDHMPDPAEYSFEEAGTTESYFFLRYRDSATVVYKVAVTDRKVTSVRLEVYHGESSQEEPDEQVSSGWRDDSFATSLERQHLPLLRPQHGQPLRQPFE